MGLFGKRDATGTVAVLRPSEEAIRETNLRRELEERVREQEELDQKRDLLEAMKRERLGHVAKIEQLEGDRRLYVVADTTGLSPSGLIVGGEIQSLAFDSKRALEELDARIAAAEKELEMS
jgi:hypothetical protein